MTEPCDDLPPVSPPPEDEGDDGSWLCDCGHYEDSPYHCEFCGAEPPWGCECGCADEMYDPDDDESWMEDVP